MDHLPVFVAVLKFPKVVWFGFGFLNFSNALKKGSKRSVDVVVIFMTILYVHIY